MAERTVAAIVVVVPSFADAFAGGMGHAIENAVELALGGFLELATSGGGADASTPIDPALDGAYALGRGEARGGRSMDALLAAYRVGARVSWREMSSTAVAAGLSVESLARFAELVFAYIDQLSAASVAGHTDELATSGRVRERYLERLAGLLLVGAPADDLTAAAGGGQLQEAAQGELDGVLDGVAHAAGERVGVGGDLDDDRRDGPLRHGGQSGPDRRRHLRGHRGPARRHGTSFVRGEQNVPADSRQEHRYLRRPVGTMRP